MLQFRAPLHAKRLIDEAAPDEVVSIRKPTRSLDQNAKMWAMLTDIAKAEPEGRKHTPEQWKAIFMQAAGWEVAFIAGLDGHFFPVGFKTSKMTMKQMADLIEWIQSYGDQHGVVWSEPSPYEGWAA